MAVSREEMHRQLVTMLEVWAKSDANPSEVAATLARMLAEIALAGGDTPDQIAVKMRLTAMLAQKRIAKRTELERTSHAMQSLTDAVADALAHAKGTA
jgi:hypothetical protein